MPCLPNTACSRRVGVAAFSGSLRGLKLIPAKRRSLVSPRRIDWRSRVEITRGYPQGAAQTHTVGRQDTGEYEIHRVVPDYKRCSSFSVVYKRIFNIDAEGDDLHSVLQIEELELTIFSAAQMEKMAPYSTQLR